MDTYGDRLEHALQFSGKSRKDLCLAIGVTLQALGQVLSGKTKALTSENSARAARFLEVDHYWLATGQGQIIDDASHRSLPEADGDLKLLWCTATSEAKEVARFALASHDAPLPPWADKDKREHLDSMLYAALRWLRSKPEQKKDAA